MSTPPFKIFISHIHEETALATAIKEGLEDAFPSQLRVFVSSDLRDNPGGERWLDKIERELKDPQTRMVISVISPASVRRLWVLVELGAAWALNIGVFPLCHSGIAPSGLPRPLQDFTGVGLDSDDAADRLIASVETQCRLAAPKRWSRVEFLRELREATVKIAYPAEPGVAAPAAQADSDGPDLAPEQVILLQLLAQLEDSHQDDVTARDAGAAVRMKASLAMHHLKTLVDLDLARESLYASEYHYSISEDGVGWLLRRDALPG